jgi:hypothetical protein
MFLKYSFYADFTLTCFCADPTLTFCVDAGFTLPFRSCAYIALIFCRYAELTLACYSCEDLSTHVNVCIME